MLVYSRNVPTPSRSRAFVANHESVRHRRYQQQFYKSFRYNKQQASRRGLPINQAANASVVHREHAGEGGTRIGIRLGHC